VSVIAIVNQKGGCGKTTTAINLSACLALQGQKTLLVDLDPQGHASLGLNIDVDAVPRSMFDVLARKSDPPTRLQEILVERAPNLWVAPSSPELSRCEQLQEGSRGTEHRLRAALFELDQDLDYIVIDAPTNPGLLTLNALQAAQKAIVPVEPSYFSLHGVGKISEMVSELGQTSGHRLQIRLLMTCVDHNTRLSRELIDELRRRYPGRLYLTMIHSNVKIREAASFGCPISEYDVECQGFRDYFSLAREVVAEEDGRERRPAVAPLRGPRRVPEGILFTLVAHNAESAHLVGDFKGWISNSVTMKNERSGLWSLVVPLRPGRYQYRFVIDGEWITDPSNPAVEVDSLGRPTSVIEVE
jgi:chromosome partitioning protein